MTEEVQQLGIVVLPMMEDDPSQMGLSKLLEELKRRKWGP